MRGTLVAIAVALVLSACASPEPAPEPENTNPYGGFPVDPPAADEIVLTLNGEETIELTYSELQTRASVTYDILEPFVLREESFTGVLLEELAAEAGIASDARVETVALNGYQYADTLAALVDSGAIVAVARDGEPIPMDEGGPIRLVYPTDSEYADFLDAWNWSLRTIETE